MPASIIRFSGGLVLFALAGALAACAEPIKVRYPQGSEHAFLSLRSMEGKSLATGEVTQTVRGDVVTSRLVFRFRDGSVDQDDTVFTQRGVFRLVKDHRIQRGRSFPKAVDMLIDVQAGQVTTKADGMLKVEHMDLPEDVSNGLPPNLLLNILSSTAETKISYVAPGAKPRLIHLSIKPSGTLPFRLGDERRTANEFTMHVELGGVAGVVAPLIGKEPADYHLWIMPGNPPAFVREDGQLYEGGPVWRIEQISASFVR